MFLRSIEIAGFKSFGSRVKLELSPGIIGVVGSNGVGKSNLADAIRWVLGEQSTRLLRAKKSEEVIFAGTDRKSKASMAEVTILLDNSDHAMPIEFSEIEITRRLYRSGESEYLLNKHKVRLADVAEILAQSGFGQNSYSVIGQGMIDNLILASPQNRKLMFEEASGIRAFELRRDSTRKKLEATKQNLVNTDQIIGELSPQREMLRQKFEALDRKKDLESKLRLARINYITQSFSSVADQRTNLEHQLKLKHNAADKLQQALNSLHATQKQKRAEQSLKQKALMSAKKALKEAEKERDIWYDKLAQAKSRLHLLKTKLSESAVSQNEQKKQKSLIHEQEKKLDLIKKKYAALEKNNRAYEEKIAVFDDNLKTLNAQLLLYRRKLTGSQKSDYILHALGLVNMLRQDMKKDDFDRARTNIILHKLTRVIKLASEEKIADLLADINKQQKMITHEMTRREEILDAQTTEIIKMRACELDIAYLEKELVKTRASVSNLKNDGGDQAESKLLEKETKEVGRVTAKVEEIDARIASLRDQIMAPTVENETRDLEFMQKIEQTSSAQAALGVEIRQLENQIGQADEQLRQTEKMADNWGVEPIKTVNNQPLETLDEIHRLEAQLSYLSEIDPSSSDEYIEIDKKLNFLQNQRDDLAIAITDMEKIQANLDRMIMEKFEDSFKKINKKFSVYFEKLFGGGEASLTLKKESDGEYGIEIMAKPPGKRIELLTSLSGGEKALASVALLAAILSINPSPFVALDEVDAALDDINSIKFNQILKELERKSQLIIITHNHQTMQQATELVGVVPHKDGDSKLLHVRLQEAVELAV